MVNKVKIRKIVGITLAIWGTGVFLEKLFNFVLNGLLFPFYSRGIEGRLFVSNFEYQLQEFPSAAIRFAYLLVIAYLIYPSKLEQYTKILKGLFLSLSLFGLGVTFFTLITSGPPGILFTLPFFPLGVLALLGFEKARKEEK